jgi:hypothetical protein
MVIRRAFYYWLFPAAVAVPAWLFVGWAVFGPGGPGFVALLFGAFIYAVVALVLAAMVVGRKSVREERAVSWRDVGVSAAWTASMVGVGFFGPATGWFAVAAIALAIVFFWLALAELLGETARRVRSTLDEFERQARPTQRVASPADGFEGDVLIVRETKPDGPKPASGV